MTPEREKLEKMRALEEGKSFDKEAAANEEEAAARDVTLNELKAAIEKITGEKITDFVILTAKPGEEKGEGVLVNYSQGRRQRLGQMLLEAFDAYAHEHADIMQPLMIRKALQKTLKELL